MKISEFSVKNSLLVNLLTVLIIFVGIFATIQLRKEAFPPVAFDTVTVTTSYPGAPAEDVEKLVTIPIEKEIKGISGIKELTSKSEEGLSEIGITIDPKYSDKAQVVDDIQRGVDRVNSLPEGVKDDPVVFELRSKEIPVLEISLGGGKSEMERRKTIEELETQILNIDGVAKVNRFGWRDPQFQIEVDPDKLKAFHVSINEIMAALNLRNVALPGGHLDTKNEEFNIRTTGEFNTTKEIENVIIRANDAGNWLKIKDVAKVVYTFEDAVNIARTNGKNTLGIVVIKNESADIIKVVSKVNNTLDQFRKRLPSDMEIITANDMSFYVKRRLGVLRNNGIIGFLLVVGILFLFLDPAPAIATAFGIPIALFSTFFIMHALGISINLVSMLGLIIVLGMLVDDGIIVSENVYRYIEDGMAPREAAIKGTSEVMAPVTATILTTFAAFGPLLFIPDIMGKFIKQIPIVVMIALGSSLVEAFFMLPSHLSDFIKKNNGSVKKHVSIETKGWFKSFRNFYLKVLDKALTHKYKVLVLLIIATISIILFAVFVAKVKVILFTGEGVEMFSVRAEAKKGTSLDKMEELMIPVEKTIEALPKEDISSYRTYVGNISDDAHFDPNSKNGSHLAQITVFLTPMQSRKDTPKQIEDRLRKKLKKINGFERLYLNSLKEGPPAGKAVQVGVKGENFKTLQEISEKIYNYLQGIKGVSDISTSYEFGKKDLKVVVDEEKAKKYFLTINDVATTVRNIFKGGVATTVKPQKAEDEIDVVVRFPKKYRNSFDVFDKIYVMNKLGNLIPLKSVAKIEESQGVYAISHLDGDRVIWVTSDVDGDDATSLSVNLALKKEFANISNEYSGYSLKFGGEYEEQRDTQINLLFSFMVALFLIFIILTAEFGSLVQPFIVMTAIPFGFLGILIAFMLHGRPLSFFALMGAVGLAGIVVNDSIVLVDFTNKLRISGKSRRESLLDAGKKRLRPVLMTSITTIGGLVSVAYGIGGGDPFLKPMGLAIVWGLFFATGLTLVVIPCIYAVVDDIVEKMSHPLSDHT